MDTIELGYNSIKFQQVVWNNALRLGVKSKKGIIDGSTGRRYFPKKMSAYHVSQEFSYKGRPFHISYNPKFPRMPAMKIVFHLSKFRDWEEFYNLSMILCDGMIDDFLDGRVTRLDQCVDIDLPFETLRKVLFVKNVCKCFLMNNRGGVASLTLGREPHQFILYSKEIDAENVDLTADDIISDDDEATELKDDSWNDQFKHLDASEGGRKTSMKELAGKKRVCRIESRHWHKKVPIKRLRDIEALKNAKAFDHICFKSVNPQLTESLKGAALRDIQAFLYQSEQRCYQMAKLEFAQDKTYQKKIEPYLNTVPLIDFDKAWKNRWDRWFGKDFRLPI